MMTQHLKYLALLLITIGMQSCTDEVDLDVDSAPPELVVDGVISNDRELYVKLSQTSGFFDNAAFKKISGARVSLFENGQEVSVLDESPNEAGTYLSNFKGNIGSQYKIRIEISNNAPDQILGTWWSSADTMKRFPKIDSIVQRSLDRNTNPQVFEAGEYAVMYFGDFEGRGDYYRVTRSLNDSIFAQENFFISDEILDGFYFGRGEYPGMSLYGPFEDPEPGEDFDSLGVRLESVTEGFFDYMQVLGTQVQTGTPFDSPPALVLGNIQKENEAGTYAFGYFQVVAGNNAGLRYEP